MGSSHSSTSFCDMAGYNFLSSLLLLTAADPVSLHQRLATQTKGRVVSILASLRLASSHNQRPNQPTKWWYVLFFGIFSTKQTSTSRHPKQGGCCPVIGGTRRQKTGKTSTTTTAKGCRRSGRGGARYQPGDTVYAEQCATNETA